MKARASRSLVLLIVVLIGAVLTGAATSQADAPGRAAVLSARVIELRNSNGKIGCALFTSEKGFPKDVGAAAQMKWCSITNKQSLCNFDPLPPGTYAVVCIHDENDNRKMDTGMFGIPTEGVVASNHAKGFMGPPKFKDAKFWFAGTATEILLTMWYR